MAAKLIVLQILFFEEHEISLSPFNSVAKSQAKGQLCILMRENYTLEFEIQGGFSVNLWSLD